MRAPVINIFRKSVGAKPPGENQVKASPPNQPLLNTMPSWWMVLFAYGLSIGFCLLTRRFFIWFPPYLLEVFKNLRGLPVSWADLGLYWGESGLTTIAVAAAVYHHLWQIGTRYKLTPREIYVESWFPIRRVTAVPYGSVRNTGFQQSPLGLLFNYGHIEIDTGSPSGPLVLLNCPRPKLFLQTLQPKVESSLHRP